MKFFRLIATITLAVLALNGSLNAQAQTPPSQYFPQTGHSVQGDFLRFFNTYGGLEIFGYPLTEAFLENGRQVQYFQRARMELAPENPEPQRVQLGKLGVELGYNKDGPLSLADVPAANDPNRRYFPQTGYSTGYAFLKYFSAHGGVDIFGYPISEFKPENGRTVQYFERAKFEWHPELPTNQRVQLGNLGEIYATTRLESSLLLAIPAQFAPNVNVPQITSLRATASLRQSITGPTGQQTLYVYVIDQHGKSVQGASSRAVVRFPSGDREVLLPTTDASGHAEVSFELGQLRPGQLIVVQVFASWAALATETRTSFFVWW